MKDTHANLTSQATENNQDVAQDIAIVGMSFRFPGASTKQQFWENLVNKVSSIVEIPTERWDWREDYDPAPKKDQQKTVSKWGGFIEAIDAFDAPFFAISPKEANYMDPQQRLSMELAWQCFEDAGIAPSDYKNTKTGVYVGCSNTDYQQLTTGNIEPHFLTGMSTGVFANRISHYFNFHGPSLTVDTACSSSLVAIHKAMKDFKMNEISAALVGGVNLLITKGRYISFSKMGVMSATGQCKTLDAGADGYVRGEGVGMILLLPLERALEQNTTIYGIIRGSSVSHSGKTKTLTSPSPFSQSRAIQEAQEAAGIHSNQVSYIEMHGTGTRLGDPIEIQGLKRAFRATKSDTVEAQSPCYLTTVKTNIGHLESAAGIAGVIKVLLSFAYNKIPPLQNFEQLNPKISFDKSPFEVVTEAKEWPADESQGKRLAGVSSFGFAGVNSHIVLEEPPKPLSQQLPLAEQSYAIVFSAKTEKALMRKAIQMLVFIQNGQLKKQDLYNIAYTLQIGREAMKFRLGFMAGAVADIKEQLELFCEDQPGSWQTGKEGEQDKNESSEHSTDADQDETSLQATLLNDWLEGYSVDWNMLYQGSKPKRISLPAYPFSQKRYWINQPKPEFTPLSKSALHPLLHESLPSLNELAFVSRFDGNEFFLKDHIVNKQRILPGVCTLEMVSEAMLLCHILEDDDSIVFENVSWLRPLVVDKSCEVYLSLWQNEDDIAFELWRQQQDQYHIYAQGQVSITKPAKPKIDLSMLNDVQTTAFDAKQIYQLFQSVGIDYGRSFQGLESITKNCKSSIAKVKVDSRFCDDFSFSPVLLDSALQSLVVYANKDQLALPFAVEQVEFHHSMPEEVWVSAYQITDSEDTVQKFDVDICDAEGNVCVRFNGFSTRALPSTANVNLQQPQQDANEDALSLLKPCWLPATTDLQQSDVLGTLKTQYQGPAELKPANAFNLTEDIQNLDHLIWLAENEYAEPLVLFKQIKWLLDNGYASKPLALTLITSQTQQVHFEATSATGAGLIGLTQSLAQEYPRWHLRIVDRQQGCEIPWQEIASLPAGFYSYREHEFYQFAVSKHQYQNLKATTYRENGVYVVLGGAGGLGQAFSEWMIHNYNAQLVWIGRREDNEAIKEAIARLGQLGKAPLYFSADAGDFEAMQTVLNQVKQSVPRINGVVHSILHLEDQSLAKMTEAQFVRSYQAKQQTGEVLLKLFADEPVDFVLFFSSLQSFSPAAGQSNYAAGCHYLDSLALSYQSKLPIKVINWGYWGSIGIVQDEFYQKKMQQAGIGSIEIEQGMQALQQFFGSGLPQIGVVKMQPAQLSHAVKQQSYSDSDDITLIDVNPSSLPFNYQQQQTTESILPALCHALHQAGWHLPEQREKALAALPEYYQIWWAETQSYLSNNGLLEDGMIKQQPYTDSDEQEKTLLDVCLAQLPQILSAEKKATDVVFPNGSLHLVEAVYQNNPVADYANQVLVEQLQQYLTQMPLPAVKVLEIGAGTGGTTRSVLPALKPWNVEQYAYTDLSKAFFNHAKAQFQPDYPFVKTQYFDIGKPLAAQDIELAAYDVVIATNVLHATPNIRQTLKNAKACLKPGGALLINEVVEKSLFTQLTFGLLQGWWLSADKALRIPGSPMLSLDNWTRVLKEEGFENVQAPTQEQSPQQILIAQSNGQFIQQIEVKKALEKKADKRPTTQPAPNKPVQSNRVDVLSFVQQTLFEVASETLSIPQDELDGEESFADYGVDSILAVQILEDINTKLDLNLPATQLFDYPSIDTLSAYIGEEFPQHLTQFMPEAAQASQEQAEAFVEAPVQDNVQPVQSSHSKSIDDSHIAIVGMSGQFGSATDLDEFWSMLMNKETSCTEQKRWDLSVLSEKEQSWSRYASLLDGVAEFDPVFFSITPQEAMYMDPQQRLFLQESYRALEDANMTKSVSGKDVGVYLGCAQSDYASLASDDAPAQIFWGNAGSVIPARVSYFLNLKGPAIAVDTACSSSLVAIHMACQALSRNEISSALVGGVAALCTPKFSNHAGKAGMLSPDGTCYTFDDRANGFVPGEGVGVLVLKRLADAERDNDQIYGVILGSATNQDGTTSGITAPSSVSQEQLHRDVYERFDISAESISMIEAHGTGTKLGDPIEFQALTRAFRKDTEQSAFCALGSVKTNIGHCLTAAGVAGVIKTLLAMKYQTIPASNNFETGNTHINWQNSPFYVNQQAQQWQTTTGQKRRAAVSSFGFSGTNAHVVLEEYSPRLNPAAVDPSQPVIIALSAKTFEALKEKAQQLLDWMQKAPESDTELMSIAYTLHMGREEMDCRLAFVAHSISDMREQLTSFTNRQRGNWKKGEVKQGKDILNALDDSDFSRWIEQGSYNKLMSLWVVGAKIDWPLLYGDVQPATLRLPTYPFAKERFWLSDNNDPTPPKPTRTAKTEIQFAQTADNTQQETTSKAIEASLLQYAPVWKAKNIQHATQKPTRIQVISVGDLGLTDAKVLGSDKAAIVEQLEDYSLQLLDILKGFEGTKQDTLLQLVMQGNSHLTALSGMLKTAALEYAYLQTQLIIVDDLSNLASRVTAETTQTEDNIVHYHKDSRHAQSFVEQSQATALPAPFKEGGVYVITGGLGQLGQVFAKEILNQTTQSTVVLIGRKPNSTEIQQQLKTISAARIHYKAADISNLDSTQLLLEQIVAEHGSVTGIIHSAGVIKDQLITNKTADELRQVFSAKVAGVVALDEASQQLNLDFFMCFSSIAAVFGNLGQADYATANAFLDHYMTERQHLVELGQRKGMSISLNWPLWFSDNLETGMQVDDVTRAMLKSQGIIPLPASQGIKAFYQAFCGTQSCFLYGDPEKLASLWARQHQAPSKTSGTATISEADLMQHIKSVIAEITKIPVEELDEDVDFKDMGFDSIMSMSIMQRLEEDADLNIGDLPPTLLFEVTTIEQLHAYLFEHHASAFAASTYDQTELANVLTYDNQSLPLSKAQEGLWLLHKQYPRMTAYNVPLVFEVENLNLQHMQTAVDWLCQKHPVLRLTMTEIEGRPQQTVQLQTLNVEEVCFNAASRSELVNHIQNHIKQAFYNGSHSLENQPLWRATSWQVDLNGQPLKLMVLVFHHLIIDGVSATLLLEQLYKTYQILNQGGTLGAPVEDPGFFSYIEWEKNLLVSNNALKLSRYWQNELQGELPLSLLPNRKGQPQRTGERIVLPIDNELNQQLTHYFEQNDIHAPVFFLTCFQLLISRHTHSRDIILGVPVLHRPKQEMNDAIGLFVNQLPLRNTIDPSQDFQTLANSNQNKLLGLINHSGYPFSEMVRLSNAPRNQACHPVFQMGFAYHNFVPMDWFEQNQTLVKSLWQEFQQEPELDLSLDVTPLPEQYRLVFKYDASVYDKNTIEPLAQAYIELLRDVVSSGNRTISSYPLFANQPQLKNNNTTIVELFDTQANKTPDHIAVTYGSASLTYQELNKKANGFANHLLQQGVQQEALIALCVKPSLDLIIAILGILKAGAAYVPIDPNSPQERMNHILQDADPDALVVQSDTAFDFDSHYNLVYLDTCLTAMNPTVVTPAKVSPGDLAYIIYTSGSTGKPKGVLVEHENVTALFNNTQRLFNFSEKDTWCLFHSYAFDFSVWEICGALLHGGKLTIPDDQTRKDTAAFAQFIADQQITILNQTPSAFFPLMDIMLTSPTQMQSLRKIIFGGEALELVRLKPWFAANIHLPDLVNMYGITETTVHVTEITVTKDQVLQNSDKSIIGRPLPGYTIHLLDEQKQPVPQGQVGEIYVGGCGVSRGYYKRPDLTKERFITSSLAQGRLYRSGDLARLNQQGLFEYVGRADDQVQIRGFRIELGEIQQALLSLDYLTDATVVAIDKQQGKVLVAYLIAAKPVSVATLRADLLTLVPEYMVPSFFTFVEKYPLTNNGKIDKKALAQLPLSSNAALNTNMSETIVSSKPLSTSESEIQQRLKDIWQQVLEIDSVGIDEPFFEAGGTSILANVLASKIDSQIGVNFPLTNIFQYSTIREMAKYIAQQSNGFTSAPAQITAVQTAFHSDQQPQYIESSLAIIGVSCHYPQSNNHQAFWQNLMAGKDLVNRLDTDNSQDDITWLDSWIEGQDHFDPAFFKISEKNARTLSYSARQLLLHGYKAIEDAGYNPDNISNTGVYVSSSGMDTPDLHLQDKIQDDQFVLTAQDYVASTLNQPGTLPTLISYHLGLQGPSLFVHSNCSSSLSAVALASSALKANEIDYALVGAACFYPQRYTGYRYEKGLNFAKDARCKVFDESADGMVGGNGVAVLLLKRAQDAIADADHIYSLIRGVNVNNDGKERAGFFAPGTLGQMSVIQQALKNTNVSAESISYVEAHGTGTSLGDPIEFASLQQVYQQYTDEKQFCGLGAVKSNLGHTDTLAGLTGLLKTALSLHHKQLPASLHYNKANPQINLDNSPFYVVKDSQNWNTPLLPRRSAVSSFGIGGTNAHGILEEFDQQAYEGALTQQPSIIVLSAAQESVLSTQVAELLAFIESNELTEQHRVSLAYTLQTGRKVMAHRIGFVASSMAELKDKLRAYPALIPAENGQYQEILNRWIESGSADWSNLYQGEKVIRMSLPTYPFALKKYPLASMVKQQTQSSMAMTPSPMAMTTVAPNDKATLQLQSPNWLAKPADVQSQNDTNRLVVFCEVPAVAIDGVATKSLFTNRFSLEQKIEDYGYQLVEILKAIAESKANTLVQLVLSGTSEDNLYFSFHSLLKTASLECPTLTTQTILIGEQDIVTAINENQSSQDKVIRYHRSTREVLQYHPIASSQPENLWVEDGVYLMTGGLGGICSELIKDINRQPFHKTVIATGRKPVEHPKVQQQLATLQNDNTTLKYYQLDVSKKMDVIRFVRDVLRQFNTLSGVIHAAGVLQDKLFINKDKESFSEVLAPKVKGVIALDEATQDLPLDFFICFGGLSGVHGAFTQIDYAMANAFLDSYMHYRDTLVQQQQRCGKSRSIDWPYWKDGGMKINPQFEKMMHQLGIAPMPSDIGIEAFYQSLQQLQTLVVYEPQKTTAQRSKTTVEPRFTSREQLKSHLSDFMQTTAASLLGVDKDELDPDSDLGDAGADSIAFVSFINQLNKQYQLDLSPTLLFKHSTLNSILGYLIQEHETELLSTQTVVEDKASTTQTTTKVIAEHTDEADSIAIIGMSGQFPEAQNLDEFWHNLEQAKDCITQKTWSTEVPAQAQWMGCVSRDDNFDPLFFNIAPAEGSRIQLQESLLMMHVWKCIEDAGYDPKALAGSNTGIFIGCQSAYNDGLITSPAYAPNRMSYFLDLHGPSEGIDTTCSSSLVAVHKAVQAIKQGDCEQAIVGGVNVIDSPEASIALQEIGALSPNGRCKTFSKDADGFVRGEGVGMLFIKKLSASKRDNDAIYGTILASAINHGGKSQGFTVPNSNAQAMLLEKAWQSADIDPATLSYIECHGTGTSLGDPVEVDALKDAFKRTATKQSQCALGSVKSNIGHLEIAAGIAGVIKVLLQFKHKTLVPSLHVNELNPYLALDNSPFTVQTEKQPWACSGKRRAAVSSFGISGVNAHLVLEETDSAEPSSTTSTNAPSIVLLSASSEASLKAKVEDLSAYLDSADDNDLAGIAYTLQTGRTHQKYRMAWVVSSIAELKVQLSNFDCVNVNKVAKSNQQAIDDGSLKRLADTANFDAIARFYIEGKKINWAALHSSPPKKMHLPTYPFVSKTPKTAQDQWLVLNNTWQANELSCPADWQNHVASVLEGQHILLISQSHNEQAKLKHLLDIAGGSLTIESMLFEQLGNSLLDHDCAPDVVFFIGDKAEIENVSRQIKPLYHFIQSIEKLDAKPMQLFYAAFADSLDISREDITALLRSYTLRNSNHQWTMVEFACPDIELDWAEKLLQELVLPRLAEHIQPQANHIQYHHNQRRAIELEKLTMPAIAQQPLPFKQNGVYLIAGALGELGLKLSQCLLQQYDATLILLGRRDADAAQTALDKLTGKVHYLSCDVTNESELKAVAKYIDEKQLALNGIFHLGTAYAEQESSWNDFEQAMKIKVQGSQLLDSVFSDTQLDFFVLFSSMAVFGSLNHLSYSYGNGFQNTFSAYRNALVTNGQRSGKTLALNWGYWHSDDPVKSIENSFAEKKGYSLIQMNDAFEIIGSLLARTEDTLGVVSAHDKEKIYQNTSKLLKQQAIASSVAKDVQVHSTEQLSVSDTVISIVSNVIGIEPDELDLQCDLYEYGFDSISLLKTFQQLKARLSMDIQADAFKNMNTIQSLIDEIELLYQQSDTVRTDTTPEFILDAGLTLPAETETLPKAFEGDVKSVLLTGSTGFLGSHILQKLLLTTNATIYCLVRASSVKKAQERIMQTADLYQLDIDISRIMPILGDMEQRQLGVSKKNWDLLCAQVQHIVHTASYVNHIQPYFAFKKSVSGTSDLLKLASTNTLKMMHFVSSTTASNQVKNSHFSVNPVEDFINREKAELIASGYGQSKWVQEENIRQASLAGVPYTIYRFSEISGSSQTGIGNTNDIFHRILRMMLSVDVRPEDVHYLIDVIPVDLAAATIVCGMNDPKKRNKVYNVANPNPLSINDFYCYASNHDLEFSAGSKDSFIAACKEYAGQLAEEDDQVIMEGMLTSRPGYDEYLFESYLMPLDPYHKDNFLNLMASYDIDFINWQTLFETYFNQWKQDRYYKTLWEKVVS